MLPVPCNLPLGNSIQDNVMSNQAPWKLLRGLFSSVVPAQTLSRAGGKQLWKIERDWTWAHRYSSPKWLHTENSLHDDEIEQHENPKICCHKLNALTASRYLCRKIIIFWRHKSQTAAAYITLGWLMSTQRAFSFSDTVQLRTCTTLSETNMLDSILSIGNKSTAHTAVRCFLSHANCL